MNTMHTTVQATESNISSVRLYLEDVCCDHCLFKYIVEGETSYAACTIDREYYLGAPNTFADVHVAPLNEPEYFIEVKLGYSDEQLLATLRRKYSNQTPQIHAATRLVLVTTQVTDELASQIRQIINPCLELEVWDQSWVRQQIHDRLGVSIDAFEEPELLDTKERMENAQGFYAFGGKSLTSYANSPLNAELLWMFGPLQLRQLRESGRTSPRELLRPGRYQHVAVLMADLSSFSSFVRDTPDPKITRDCLTAFCDKSRYQIVNGGGMLYQFVGDAVLGFFGIPESNSDAVANALRVAKSILDIGASVSENWQRQIDRIQPSRGAHIGITIGDVEILSLRPFSRSRIGAFGDPINMSARLSAAVEGGQIAVSNSYYHNLHQSDQADFQTLEEVNARNVGRIKAWKLDRSSRYEC